ncbi:esterase E4-like isoform X1 [Neodiprion virginianus]|uniref:esterase E4-like isoform X1 n=1 Tax=Neodiprion virginianus TaxID=2961670 RepID=UPI001EE6AFD0|nr:esterase E4-like isoform X1 [Neodiprion virginianus]
MRIKFRSDFSIFSLLSILFTPSTGQFENDTGSTDANVSLPILTIPQGEIQGVNLVTYRNRTIYGFLGIPYSRPPIGNLRFRSPVAANAWNGTLDASTDGNMCPQLSGDHFIGDEDCLYLNVYTPQISDETSTVPLPVMVYIHGGGFERGNGGLSSFSPKYLLDKDVVLVVFNYRLGVLGFLSTGDEVAPGNYGLKDMVLALKWVQRNIGYFGGNADQVTIFGESTGGGSVELLALSRLTEGLFHRYITESGSALSIRCFRPKTTYVRRATELAELLDCPTDSTTGLVDCLRNRDAKEIIGTKSSFYVWENFPDIIWGPTDEPDVDGAFLTENPVNLYAAGKIRDLPWMTGVVHDEGLILSLKFYVNPDKFEELLSKFDDVLPYVLQYHNVVDDENALTTALKAYYFNNMTAERSRLLSNLTDLIGDSFFIFPIYNALQKRMLLVDSPEYFYRFGYRGSYSYSYKYSGGSTDNYGIAHADELLYLFPYPNSTFGNLGEEMSETDYEMVENMVQLWTSFAINGTPTEVNRSGIKIWKPYSVEDNYVMIGDHSEVTNKVLYSFLSDRMGFWKDLTGTISNMSNTAPVRTNTFFENIMLNLKCFVSFLFHT